MEEKKKYKYYINDLGRVFAKDKEGNEYSVRAKGFIPREKGTIDIMWGGLAEEHVDEMVQQFERLTAAL